MRTSALWPVLLGVAALLACSSAPRRPDGQIGLLPVAAEAPDVEAVSASGASTRLSSLRGQAVAVYFYPADGTPGCTREACAFRNAWTKLQSAHVAVIGVSSQSRESHLAFEKEQHLPFPLAADETVELRRDGGPVHSGRCARGHSWRRAHLRHEIE